MHNPILISFVALWLLSAAIGQCCMPLMAAPAAYCIPAGDTGMPMADYCLASDAALQGDAATLPVPQTITKAAWAEARDLPVPVVTERHFTREQNTPPGDKPLSFQTCVLLI